MSNNDKIAKLKEYIKNFVIKELEKDEELEEASTTATAGIDGTGTGHYDTPKAFASSASGSQGGHPKPDVVGYKKVNEIANQEISALQNLEKGLDKLRKDYMKIMNMGDKTLKNKQYNDYYDYIMGAQRGIGSLTQTLKRKQMLGEGRYHDWRNDESLTPKQKVGKSIREIRDALNELDKTVKMNLKLKTELNMNSKDYWKNTHKALTKISERLVKMANKIGNMK
jgi:hypothetical protein